VFEITPAGVRVTTSGAPAAGDPPPSLLGRRTVIATFLLVTLAVGLGAGFGQSASLREAGVDPASFRRMPRVTGATGSRRRLRH
jgi:hypothetical protein